MSWGLWGYDRTAAVVPGSTIFRGIDLSDLPGELSSRVHHAINQGSPDRNLHDNLLDHVGDNHGFSGWWTDDPDNAKHYAAGGHQDDNPLRAVLATDWNGEGQDYDYIDDEVGDDDVPLRDEPPRPHTVWVSRPGSPWVNISKGVPGPEERTAGANGDLPEGMIITRKDYPRYGESSWHAHHNGWEIGSLYVMPSDYSDKGAVGDINVHDDYLRRGVGTALWEAAGRPLHTPGQQTGKGKAWAQAVGGDNDFNVAWNPDDDVYDPSDYDEDYDDGDSPFYTSSHRTAAQNLDGIEFALTPSDLHGSTPQPHNRHLETTAVDTATGRQIGWLSRRPTGEIYEVSVHPDYRRRGVATALFDWTKANVDPELHHSIDMTDDGAAWARTMGWNPEHYNEKDMPAVFHPADQLPLHDGPTYKHAHRTAMPAPFPAADVTLQYHHDHHYPSVTAHADGPEPIGYLEWNGPGLDDHGEIADIHVDDDWRHQSIATAMFDLAQQHEPKLHHSDNLSDYGAAWKKYEESRTRPEQFYNRKARIMSAAVTVYTQPNCIQCVMTKKQLDKLGIAHDTVDVSADPEAHAYVRGLGYTAAPVVVVNDGEEHWAGFRPDRLKGLTG